MNLQIGVLWIAMMGLLIGCAPTSQVLKREIADARFDDAIRIGEEWLNDATLEEQASSEGRRIHRLVAEARFASARRGATVASIRAFRERYAQFSVYEDLLAAAYEIEAKLAFDTQLSQDTTWAQFEWFASHYGQSTYNPKARELILNAEFDAAKSSNTVLGWQAFRQRFSDWTEATVQLAEAAIQEAASSRRETLGADATVQDYRDYLASYPNEINHLGVLETLTKLEIQAAQEEDTLIAWNTLAGRYREPWAAPIREAAVLGIFELELEQVRKDNTRAAFQRLREKYPQRDDLQTRIGDAECGTVISTLVAQAEMRQPLRRPSAYHLLRNLMGQGTCDAVVKKQAPILVAAAKRSDLWANRILRALPETAGAELAPLTSDEEGELAWGSLSETLQVERLNDLFRWYPRHPRSIRADTRLVAIRQTDRLRTDRQKILIWGLKVGQSEARHQAVLSLLDTHLGAVAVPSNGITVLDPSSLVRHPLTLLPLPSVDLWVGGVPSKVDEETLFLEMLTRLEQQFAFEGMRLDLGIFYEKGEEGETQLAWQKVADSSVVLNIFKQDGNALTVGGLQQAQAAFGGMPIATMLVHVGGEQRQFGTHPLPNCAQANIDEPKCRQAWITSIQADQNRLLPLLRGIAVSKKQSEWSSIHRTLGFEPTGILDMNEVGRRFSRSALVQTKVESRLLTKAQNFMPSIQLFWVPWPLDKRLRPSNTSSSTEEGTAVSKAASATEENTALAKSAAANEENTAVAKAALATKEGTAVAETSPVEPSKIGRASATPWKDDARTSVEYFEGEWGKIAIVTKSKPSERVAYFNEPEGPWRALGNIEIASSDRFVYAHYFSDPEQDEICLMTTRTRLCTALNFSGWRERPMLLPKAHQVTVQIHALSHRPQVFLVGSSAGGVLRSIDAGRSWQTTQSGGSYDQFVAVGAGKIGMVCARTQLSASLNGIDCSDDDGMTWVSFLRSTARPDLHIDGGELTVKVGTQTLRLVRRLDYGSAKDELMFVDNPRRLSQMGEGIIDRLKRAVHGAGDWLLVSKGASDEATNTENLSLGLQPVGAKKWEEWRLDSVAPRLWKYAVIGALTPNESRPNQ